jgi:hypothetical protein
MTWSVVGACLWQLGSTNKTKGQNRHSRDKDIYKDGPDLVLAKVTADLSTQKALSEPPLLFDSMGSISTNLVCLRTYWNTFTGVYPGCWLLASSERALCLPHSLHSKISPNNIAWDNDDIGEQPKTSKTKLRNGNAPR